MGRRGTTYIRVVHCVVCDAKGVAARDQLGRPKYGWVRWSPPERWVCPKHRGLKPGQWAGARAILARQRSA